MSNFRSAMATIGGSCAGADMEKQQQQQQQPNISDQSSVNAMKQQQQQQQQQTATKPSPPGWSVPALMRGCHFDFEPPIVIRSTRKGMNGSHLNIRRVASLLLSAAAIALNAVSYSTHRWATMQNVPVNRYSLPLLFKDEYTKDQDCRTPLCHLLDLRRDGQLQAVVYRGLLKRCEEIEKRVGQDAMFVLCRENPENYNAEVVIVQRLQFAGMIFQATAVFCSITILTLIRLAESRRKLASFLGSLFPSLLGALLTGLALLIFSEHLLKGETLDYSFWMATISGILSVLTALLICGDMVTCPARGGGGGGGGGNRAAHCGDGNNSGGGSGGPVAVTMAGNPGSAPPLPSVPPPSTPQIGRSNRTAGDDLPPQNEFPSQTPSSGNNSGKPPSFGYVTRPPL